MSAIDNARSYLAQHIDTVLATYGVPSMSAVMVRDGGDTVVAQARGVRKWDVDHGAPSNQVRLDDRYSMGSISKAFTGYLMAYLVQTQTGLLGWETTIADVFPELNSPWFRRRYAIRSEYLGKTIEQLMTHNADLPYGPSHGYDMIFRNFAGEFVTEYSTMESEMLRRYNYVLTALQDPPDVVPGPPVQYGGGDVICGAMAERRTGISYEALMKKHVYGKLGMTRSDFGRVATSTTPDGIWGHRHNPLDGSITPDQWTTTVAWGFHSHAPAGAVSSTAEDVARFIAANLPQSGKPKLGVSDIELIRAQEQPDPAESTFSRAGWSVHGSGTGRFVEHNGDILTSYAWLRIHPPGNYGLAAMTNVGGYNNSKIGESAVEALLPILEEMHDKWSSLF